MGQSQIRQSPEEKPRTYSAVLHGQVHELRCLDGSRYMASSAPCVVQRIASKLPPSAQSPCRFESAFAIDQPKRNCEPSRLRLLTLIQRAEQGGNLHVQRIRQPHDVVQRQVALPTLHRTDVIRMQFGPLCKGLLRQCLGLTKAAQSGTKDHLRFFLGRGLGEADGHAGSLTAFTL